MHRGLPRPRNKSQEPWNPMLLDHNTSEAHAVGKQQNGLPGGVGTAAFL